MENKKDKVVEYTPEGFAEAAQALDFLPEELRETMLATMLNTATSA